MSFEQRVFPNQLQMRVDAVRFLARVKGVDSGRLMSIINQLNAYVFDVADGDLELERTIKQILGIPE